MAGAATIWLVGFGLLPFLLPAATMAAGPVRIGASEFVYSDLAQQIGGSAVSVTLLDRRTVAARGNSLAGSDLILSGGTAADAWLRDAVSGMRHLDPSSLKSRATPRTNLVPPSCRYTIQTPSRAQHRISPGN